MNETTVKTEKPECPACKGRGGFDGPDDCFDCAWCNGSGRATVEEILAEGMQLVDRLRQSANERNMLRGSLAAIVRCGDKNSHDIALDVLERKP